MIDVVKDLGYGAALAEADLPVAGMTCNNCANTITRTLKRLDGVLDVNTSYASERTHVTYLPSMVEVGDIKRAVRDAGYKVIEVEGASEQEQVDAEQAARNAEIADKRRKVIVGAVLSTIIMILSMAEMVGIPLDFPGPPVAGGRPDHHRSGLSGQGLLCQRVEGAQEPHRQHGYAGGAWGPAWPTSTAWPCWCLRLDPMHYHVYFESAAMILTLITVGKYPGSARQRADRRGHPQAAGAARQDRAHRARQRRRTPKRWKCPSRMCSSATSSSCARARRFRSTAW